MANSATTASTISRIVSNVDAFADVDISAADSGAVRDLLKRVSRVKSWASAAESVLLNRADELAKSPPPTPPPPHTDEGDAGVDDEPEASESDCPGPSPHDLLTGEGNTSNAHARTLQDRAELLKILIGFRDALLANRISGEHVDEIVKLLAKVPLPDRDEFLRTAITGQLHEVAACESVETFGRTIRTLLQALRNENHDEKLRRQIAQTYLSMWTNRDGMLVLNGEFDPEIGNIVRKYFDDFTGSLFHAHQDSQLEIPDGVTDKTKWLRAQALIHTILGRTAADLRPNRFGSSDSGDDSASPTATSGAAERSHHAPAAKPPTSRTAVVLFADAHKLADRVAEETGAACGHFVDSTPIGARTLRRLACDAAVMPMVFSSDSEPLDVGRENRTASRAQRRALAKMYGGCMFCSTPFDWCQIHHFWHWADLGPSDLWNMGPLCNHHHHQVHDVGYFIAQTHGGTLALLAPDGTIIATTSIAHPRPPAGTVVDGSGYTSVFAAGIDQDAAGGRRSPEPTVKPKGSETFTIGNPSRGPDPVLLS